MLNLEYKKNRKDYIEGVKHFIEKYKEVTVGGESISDDPNNIYYETFNDNPNEEDFSEYFDIDQKETDSSLDEMYGGLIESKITLDYNDSVQDETILRRNRNTNESLIRAHNNSPIPDTIIYQVDFRDDKLSGCELILFRKIYTNKWFKMTILEPI